VAKETEQTKVVRKPATRRTRKPVTAKVVPHEHIAERAYYIALAGGVDPFDNWLRAERELATT
jgi:hypothetical protein